jgi:hypothetical protein
MTENSADNDRDATNVLRLAKETQRMILERFAARYEGYFGRSMDFLLSNPTFVRPFADHPDPGYRSLALGFLARHSASAESTTGLLMRKAREDPSEAVRRCAIRNLALLKHEYSGADIPYFLKNIVCDAREDASVRKAAYFGIAYFDRYDTLMDYETFNFPEQVDWDYLERLLPGTEREQARS